MNLKKKIELHRLERASGTEETAQQEIPTHTEMPDWHGNLPVIHHLEN